MNKKEISYEGIRKDLINLIDGSNKNILDIGCYMGGM